MANLRRLHAMLDDLGDVTPRSSWPKGASMKISIKRTGGLAGLAEQVAATDTAELDPATAQTVEQAIQHIGFFSLPAHASEGIVGADLFHYEVTVTDGGRRHTVGFDDDGSPEVMSLRTLVDTLVRLAGNK
jgi:hypothetical protein